MNIQPLLKCQPDTSREEFGQIMATYLGGRAEVRIRREVRQVLLTDFKSMYPTVNTLMGLGAFVVGDGYTHQDTTADTQALIDQITLADLQRPDTWRRLATIVQLRPSDDILPLRTRYSEDRDALTIGLNHVRSEIPLWYTLADVIVSKLLNGRSPEIDQAISFQPGPVQAELEPISLLGRSGFRVDP